MTSQLATVEVEPEARIRARFPLMFWRRHRFQSEDDRIVEVDQVWTTARRWNRSTAALDPAWKITRIGPFVLALRLVT